MKRLLVALLLISTPAASHEWFTNKYNPVSKVNCCDDRDCKVIEDENWWREGDKYFVRWEDGVVYSIPASHALPSEDKTGKAAACVMYGNMRCFFLPVTG